MILVNFFEYMVTDGLRKEMRIVKFGEFVMMLGLADLYLR